MSYAIKAIPVLTDYFTGAETPVVVEEYAPGRGWRRSSWRKRISRNYARMLARQGVTHVQLAAYDPRVQRERRADFAIEELR